MDINVNTMYGCCGVSLFNIEGPLPIHMWQFKLTMQSKRFTDYNGHIALHETAWRYSIPVETVCKILCVVEHQKHLPTLSG